MSLCHSLCKSRRDASLNSGGALRFWPVASASGSRGPATDCWSVLAADLVGLEGAGRPAEDSHFYSPPHPAYTTGNAVVVADLSLYESSVEPSLRMNSTHFTATAGISTPSTVDNSVWAPSSAIQHGCIM